MEKEATTLQWDFARKAVFHFVSTYMSSVGLRVLCRCHLIDEYITSSRLCVASTSMYII